MAMLRPKSHNETLVDENNMADRQKVINKAPVIPARGQSRKALGDIGNLVGPFNTRCNVGKENVSLKDKEASIKQAKQLGVMTRRSAARAGVIIDDKVLSQVQGRKSRHSVKSAAKGDSDSEEVKVDSRNQSLSGLLVTRSEDIVTSKSPVPAASPLPDIDSLDKGNPLAVSEYANDIFAYYRKVEPFFMVTPEYMKLQSDINEKMRAILLDWLVEVHLKFKLLPETLFLTTNLIDRFLEKHQVTRKNLQLVGVTSMLIASKYEEIWAPEVRDFVYISDRAYTKQQILDMEKLILNTLKFDLTVPTSYTFLCRFLKAAGNSDRLLAMHAAYLVELSIPDYGMLKYSYSEIAAAAVMLSNKVLGAAEIFPDNLRRHSFVSMDKLNLCYADLEKLQSKASGASLVAVYKKYSSSKYMEVATNFGEAQAEKGQ